MKGTFNVCLIIKERVRENQNGFIHISVVDKKQNKGKEIQCFRL